MNRSPMKNGVAITFRNKP